MFTLKICGHLYIFIGVSASDILVVILVLKCIITKQVKKEVPLYRIAG